MGELVHVHPHSHDPVGIPGGGWGKARPWGFPEGKRRSPTTSGVSMHIMGHRPHHFPSPTSTTLCHTARGCAGRRTTPGSGRSAFPTPQGVVPFVPAGGCGKQGRNEIRFTSAEEESTRNVFPISPKYTHLTYNPFEPSAQPRWGCLCLCPLPGVAPRRRNPGLCGRIPLGFPEGEPPSPGTASFRDFRWGVSSHSPICFHLCHLWINLSHSRLLASIRGSDSFGICSTGPVRFQIRLWSLPLPA